MHPVDIAIFILYIVGMLSFGYFFFRKNKSSEDYYVGGRNMSSVHIGLSVVATDVGGGFSIGLGGLGFVMGLSGAWMLFTGLIGAWLAAVVLIPKVKSNPKFAKFVTFPQIFEHYYGLWIALLAGLISAIGYAGFTSSQILAGAKLANGTFQGIDLNTALIVMGCVAVIYTVMGGLKAVIYTDTIQWAILMFGLVFIGIPLSFYKIGGWEAIQQHVQPGFLSLTNVSWQQLVNWGITIIPIWFVGMTLYQRIYACRDEKTAKKAWFMAGLFEFPVMAFMGVALGMFARIAADQGMFIDMNVAGAADADPETGLPMLLREILPFGLRGIMMAAYFSAILSTADSCLMASSGNFVSDVIGFFWKRQRGENSNLVLSQVVTFIVGGGALLLALSMENVLSLMLKSYAFMVGGLLIPILGALYWKRRSPVAAGVAMIMGGAVTSFLQFWRVSVSAGMEKSEIISTINNLKEKFPGKIKDMDFGSMPNNELVDIVNIPKFVVIEPLNWHFALPYGLDPLIFGIGAAAILFVIITWLFPSKKYSGLD